MIRTFVAIELEHDLRLAIGRIQDQLKDRIRDALPRAASGIRLQWVRPESIHLTLKFLGDVEEGRTDSICRALTDAASMHAPFSINVQGLGVFPDLRAPKVLWIGLADPGHRHLESLEHLVGAVERALGRLGFPLESRLFHPHLTLARMKEQTQKIGRALREGGLMQQGSSWGTIDVRAIALMQSVRKPTGSVYTALCRASLAVESF